MKNAIAMPTTTSVAKTSEMNANHEAPPRSGRDESLSTIATAASAIVGSSTMKPQKMNACIRPGPSFWSSFFWRKTWVISRVMRSEVGAPRPAGRAFATSATRGRTRPHEQDDRHDDDGREGRGGYGARPSLLDLLGEGRDDLEQVAHHAQVRDLQDRRVGVLRDRHDPLRALHADQVLERAADPGADVDLGLHGLAGLPDLVAVRDPAGVDGRARGADRGVPDRRRQLVELLERVRAAQPSTAGDDDLRALELAGRSRPPRVARPARPSSARRGRPPSTSTTSAVPPDGSAANDCGRTITSFGAGPFSSTSTIFVPPRISVRALSGPSTSVAFAISVEPVRACSRPATSRAS